VRITTNNLLSKYFIFLLLATCVWTGVLRAQDYKRTFTLPIETKWGQATLPAGDYSFTIDTASAPYVAKIRWKNGGAFVIAGAVSDRQSVARSELVLVRRGNKGTVRALALAIPSLHHPNGGLVFSYPPPKSERRMLAQAPVLIQRVPVLMAAK
jgi:hypothetical protein